MVLATTSTLHLFVISQRPCEKVKEASATFG